MLTDGSSVFKGIENIQIERVRFNLYAEYLDIGFVLQTSTFLVNTTSLPSLDSVLQRTTLLVVVDGVFVNEGFQYVNSSCNPGIIPMLITIYLILIAKHKHWPYV